MNIGTNKERSESLLVKPIAIGLLAGFASIFTSFAAYAACALEGDVELLHLGGRNMIVYWEEVDCNPDVVMYQTSSDNGQTWSVEDVLVSSNAIAVGGFINDFDGILIVGRRGRLAALFNVFEGGDPKLKVVTSSNFGRDWGVPILAWDVTADIPTFIEFLGCPSLEGRSIPGSGVLSLLTTIVDTGGATAWVVTSRDSGQTWDAAQELGEVPTPTECDD